MATVTDAQYAQARTDATTEIGRTDTKAGAMLTALGIPLAVLVAVLPGKDLSPAASVLVALSGIGLVASMVMTLSVIRPNLGTGDCGGRGSYLRWAECTTAAELAEDLTQDHRAERVITLARIAKAKHRRLRLAVDAMVITMVAFVAALISVIA